MDLGEKAVKLFHMSVANNLILLFLDSRFLCVHFGRLMDLEAI